MDCIRAVSERMKLMTQAAAVLGSSMQERHNLASSETISAAELQGIIEKVWRESSLFIKSLDDKKANLEAPWINKSKDLLNSLMFQENSRYFVELLLDLTEKGRSFDQQLVYTDLTLSIDAVKEAQIMAKRPDIVVVTLQHLRDEFQDSSMAESTRNDMMLDFVKLTLVATHRCSTAPVFDVGDSTGAVGVSRPGPRRNDRKRKIDQPTWEKELWLPGIMTAFGDARDTSIDSIRVVEGLLAHFVKRVVGAALEYAEDPMEVSQLDVLHVLRKNKRFLGRVTTTHSHMKTYKARLLETKIFNNSEQEKYVLATRTFDDEGAAPSRDDAVAPVAAPPHGSYDAAREATSEASVVSRPVIKFR